MTVFKTVALNRSATPPCFADELIENLELTYRIRTSLAVGLTPRGPVPAQAGIINALLHGKGPAAPHPDSLAHGLAPENPAVPVPPPRGNSRFPDPFPRRARARPHPRPNPVRTKKWLRHFCGPYRIRTGCLLIANEALYQLS